MNFGKVIKETREFMSAARAARAQIKEAKQKDSPGGVNVTKEERHEIVEDFATAAKELSDLLGAGLEVGEEVAEFIKAKLGGKK